MSGETEVKCVRVMSLRNRTVEMSYGNYIPIDPPRYEKTVIASAPNLTPELILAAQTNDLVKRRTSYRTGRYIGTIIEHEDSDQLAPTFTFDPKIYENA